MTVDLDKLRYELRHQRKHLVHTGLKPGEGIFTQSFLRLLDPNRKCIPIMFSTNPNLYTPRNLNQQSLSV